MDTLNNAATCKICGSPHLEVFAETATCGQCGVLLCFPYPEVREQAVLDNPQTSAEARAAMQAASMEWQLNSGDRNHHNFTRMATFALDETDRRRPLDLLDFGGGGGQFALVAKSLFPLASVSIVDLRNDRLLNAYQPMNEQIRFEHFDSDTRLFDVIFMNDVFEHVSDPLGVLKTLKAKLKPGGRIFIDTPCTFWLYPLTRLISRSVHTKLLRGTVNYDHQQIWTKTAFHTVAERAGMTVSRFVRLSEFTQPARFYMDSMKVTSPFTRVAGHVFFRLAPYIARNKIMAILTA